MISAKRKAVEGRQAGQAAREGPAVAFTCLARGLSWAARDVSGAGAGWACESASAFASAASSVSEAGRRYSISSYMCGKRMASMSSVLGIDVRVSERGQRKREGQVGAAGSAAGAAHLKMKSPFCVFFFFAGASTTFFSASGASAVTLSVPAELSLV